MSNREVLYLGLEGTDHCIVTFSPVVTANRHEDWLVGWPDGLRLPVVGDHVSLSPRDDEGGGWSLYKVSIVEFMVTEPEETSLGLGRLADVRVNLEPVGMMLS